MTLIIDDLEKEFEKNTNLMLDSFTFSVVVPGNLRNTNATFISSLDNTVYWEFNFNDIATNHFNMYAHSIVINNLALQIFLLIILLLFAGFIWKGALGDKSRRIYSSNVNFTDRVGYSRYNVCFWPRR